jgi:putative oxidoreductase
MLLLRIGIGLFFLGHGIPKLLGGPEKWAALGGAMGNIGISFTPTFWGFMAAISEALGGLLLILGLLVRPAAALMFFTMLIATIMHLKTGGGFGKVSHPGEMAVVFLALLVAGGGRYGLGALIRPCECSDVPTSDPASVLSESGSGSTTAKTNSAPATPGSQEPSGRG